jgi:hypothetical protein
LVIFVIQNKFCSLFTTHTKVCLNKNMPNYNYFHINCYLIATCNMLFYFTIEKTPYQSIRELNLIMFTFSMSILYVNYDVYELYQCLHLDLKVLYFYIVRDCPQQFRVWKYWDPKMEARSVSRELSRSFHYSNQ